jgi:membrane-associated phospholipid phosphatase
LHSVLRYLTDCGDTAVTVPLALLLGGFLVLTRQFRLALGWALILLACVCVISGLKVLFSICGPTLIGTLRSPSGHTAVSMLVYGAYAAMIGANCRPAARVALIAVAAVFALGIAVSRVVLHFHTGTEAVAGLAIGVTALAAVHVLVAWQRPAPLPVLWLGTTAAAAFLLSYGQRWPAEQTLHRFAAFLDILRPWCT